MSHLNVVRAWKDEEYRLSLNDTERALLPAHPAGLIQLTDGDLEAVVGGGWLQDAWNWVKNHVGLNGGIGGDDDSNPLIGTVTFGHNIADGKSPKYKPPTTK
jgi:mersacidin/lichenicidin family type 2 lantibiotic